MQGNKTAIILLGGIAPAIPWFGLKDGWDGRVTSAGMLTLERMLTAQGVDVHVLIWGDYISAFPIIVKAAADNQIIILIGYSGGASRATWLVNEKSCPMINLLVAYDPSPWWQTKDIPHHVQKAICYHNLHPMMPSIYGFLGGGQLTSKVKVPITTVDISEQHLFVQADMKLHLQTVEAVKAL